MDNSELKEYDDISIIKRFPSVITMQELHEQNPRLSFNEMQFRVFANCDRFISIQGGTSVLASYFGGTNIILNKCGAELSKGDYNYFHRFSGARIIPCTDEKSLLRLVKTFYWDNNTKKQQSLEKRMIAYQFYIYNMMTIVNDMKERVKKSTMFFATKIKSALKKISSAH